MTLTSLYRRYIPKSLREKMYRSCLKDILYVYRNFTPLIRSKLTYYFFLFFPKTERNKLYHFMGKYGLTNYPWPFVLELKCETKCFFDNEKSMFYVIHNDKKLYFPDTFKIDQVLDLYKCLMVEQDFRSPHRYLKGDYKQLEGRVLLDVGAAEGIFTLDSIEFVKHAYLFEYESNWLNALNATFAPWREKVTIVPKYVTNKDSDTETKIDSYRHYWSDSNLFIKMDIEGAELTALHGAYEVLTGDTDIMMSVCTYHRPQDAEDISSFLSSLNYCFYFTEGYMFYDKHLNMGVLRASKQSMNND